MEKQKIKIQIEKGKRILWGTCIVNNNSILDYAKTKSRLMSSMKLQIFKFEGIPPHLIEFEEEYL